ncbi:MAG: type II toxin-antitoxin system PemK/MazF family toxin [Dermatophilaceae bacterium]
MRPIHIVRLDKSRPALVLTRDAARPLLTKVTVAPVTSTVKGVVSEVPLGRRNGLDHDCVASLDNVVTIPVDRLGPAVGMLLDDQEADLALAFARTFDLPT